MSLAAVADPGWWDSWGKYTISAIATILVAFISIGGAVWQLRLRHRQEQVSEQRKEAEAAFASLIVWAENVGVQPGDDPFVLSPPPTGAAWVRLHGTSKLQIALDRVESLRALSSEDALTSDWAREYVSSVRALTLAIREEQGASLWPDRTKRGATGAWR